MSFKSILTITVFCCAFVSSNGFAYDYTPRQFSIKTTAYTHSEDTHNKWGRKTASGTELKNSLSYNSAAADWSFLPLGTEFRIKGLNRHFVIDDYGSGLVGKEVIDLYFPTKASMTKWGTRNVDIIITKYGDFEKSERVLSNHIQYSDSWHVKQMLTNIQNQKISNSKTKPILEPVPVLPTKVDEHLMAAASIPRWLWRKKAPRVKPDKQEASINANEKLTSNHWTSAAIVEPPYPDQAEWEGDPFQVLYAEPIVEPVMKVTPIKPISVSKPFYYQGTPVQREFQVVNKRFE